jgi:iron(III) transport system permease protein
VRLRPLMVRYARGAPTRRIDRALLLFCLLVLGATVLYPTLRLVVRALRAWRWDVLLTGAAREAIVNTLVICFASVALAGLVGTGLALLVARFTFPGRRPLAALAYLPFTLPPLVGVLGFYYLISSDGFIPRVLERLFDAPGLGLRGPAAILLIHTYSFYVFFYAMVGAAVAGMDHSLFEAARTLGASRLRAFTRVMLPLLKPALLGASLLTFMSAGASFSAPLFFGQNYPVLTVLIFRELTVWYRADTAMTLTLVLALIALLGVALFRSGARGGAGASKGVRTPMRSRGGRIVAGTAAWAAIVVLVLPHLTIVWLAFVDHRAWYTEIFPTTLTLENFSGLVREARTFGPIRNSMWMSGLAAAGSLVLALPAAYLIGRRRPGAFWINLLVMIPWALPGTVIALNLIAAFNDPWLRLANTVWLLPLAYFVRSVPLLTRMVTAVVEPFDASLIEAGRTLGGSRWYCFGRIVVPLLAPALTAGTALIFAMSLGEFVASILLFVPGNIPIAVQIYQEWRSSIGTACAYSVFLMILVTVTFLLSHRFGSRLV